MDPESSFQVLSTIVLGTGLLLAAIRALGWIAQRSLPDLPVLASGSPAPRAVMDRMRLVAILTAAAMEELDTDDLYLSSIVELPEPGSQKHWPRVGKMHFFQKKPYWH